VQPIGDLVEPVQDRQDQPSVDQPRGHAAARYAQRKAGVVVDELFGQPVSQVSDGWVPAPRADDDRGGLPGPAGGEQIENQPCRHDCLTRIGLAEDHQPPRREALVYLADLGQPLTPRQPTVPLPSIPPTATTRHAR
jgi:hypothetical protein